MKRYRFIYCLILTLLVCLMTSPAAAEETVCETCGQKLSEMTLTAITKDGHTLVCQCGLSFFEDHAWSNWHAQGDGTHARTCTRGCTETDVCTGGTATCTAPAQCSICSAPYGDIAPDNHSWDDGAVTVASTCKTPGTVTYTCVYNNEHTRTEALPIDPDAHYFREGVLLKPATCMESGIISYTCLYSAAHVVQETIPADSSAHRWDSGVVIHSANCVEPGEILYTCLDNPEHTRTDSLPIDLTKHQWKERIVTLEPTCTRPGEITLICALDPNHTGTEYIEPLGHEWSISTVTKEPDCETPGTLTYTCANDPSHIKEESIPATGHFWGNMEVISEPTCTTEGSKSYICGNDIDHRTIVRVAVDPNAHNYVPTDEIVSVPGICKNGEARVLACTYCGNTMLEMITEPSSHVFTVWSAPDQDHHTAVCTICNEAVLTLPCNDTPGQPCPLCRSLHTQLNSVYGITAEDNDKNTGYTVGAAAGSGLMHLSVYTEANGTFAPAALQGYVTIYLNAKQIAAALQPGSDARARRAIDILQSEDNRIMRSDDLVLIGNGDDELLLRLYIHSDEGESDELFCRIDSGVISFKLRAKNLHNAQQTVHFVLEEK